MMRIEASKDRQRRRPAILHFALCTLHFSLFVLIPAGALGDPTIQVTFPEKGNYLYWLEFKDMARKTQVTAPRRAAGEGTSIDLAPAAPDGKLAAGELKIYDPKTGNLALKNLENLADKKELKLKEADFDRVRTVRIILRPAEGKPEERVESAVVTLKDANSDEFTAVVDPSSEGTAEFHDIAAGQESITAAYDGGKMTVDLEVPVERDSPVFTYTLAISGKVRTVKAAAGGKSPKEEGAPTQQQPQAGPVGWPALTAGVMFVLLIVIVTLIYLRSRGTTLESSLKKLGVQLPEGQGGDASLGAPAPAQQIDPNVCQFCGQRKDPVTGNCACSVDAAAMRRGAAGGGSARLIGIQGPYAGRTFELTGGEMTIGRDAANAIALTDDNTSSRRHARIGRENGQFSITDEGSSNGTFVNGVRITGRRTLQPGDEVQIGSTKFRFEV